MEHLKEKGMSRAERVEELRVEWKRLWRERLDDKVRAEAVAKEDYSSLFVERGTVIMATRNFRMLTFKGILEEHGVTDAYRFVSPSPGVGGWGKFMRSSLVQARSGGRSVGPCYVEEEKKPQQLRKGGRGWLHR